MTNDAPYLRPVPEIVFTRVSEGEAVLLSLATKRYYSLNETGALIWESLEEGSQQDQLVEALVTAYDTTFEEAAELVAEFVTTLSREGLLRREAPATP